MKNILMTTVAFTVVAFTVVAFSMLIVTPAAAMSKTGEACMAEAKASGDIAGTYSRYVNCLGKKDYDLEHSPVCITYKRKHDEARKKAIVGNAKFYYWADEQAKYRELLKAKCWNY